MNISIELSEEGTRAYHAITDFQGKILPAVTRGLDLGLELALGRTLATRFTGRGPFPVADHRLGIITGRLRSSIRRSAARTVNGNVEAAVGTNVKYFGVHEYGFDGSVAVKAHKRTGYRNDQGKVLSKRAAQKQTKKGKSVTERTGEVKAHSRRVKVPARAPLRTGLEANKQLIADALSRQLVAAWRGEVK